MHRLRLLLAFGVLFIFAACTSSPEPAPPPPQPTVTKAPPPPPPPPPAREPEPAPVVELPKTASSLPSLGLAGVFALAGAGALRVLRSRIG